MPSHTQAPIQEHKQPGVTKFLTPVLIAVFTALITATGTAMYRHETAILKLSRNLEKLQIKDYRQQRDNLRQQVRFFGDAANTLGAVLEIQPDVFGPNSNLILRTRKEQHAEAKEILENYVEENKHYGSSD